MRMETYIRKSVGMQAHRVVQVVEHEKCLVAEVERYGQRRLRCGRCGMEAKGTKGRTESPRRCGATFRWVGNGW